MVLAALLLLGANDANWVSFGGAGAFAPHKTIHMLGEDINITVYDEKIHVRVYFSFENKGPATTVKMAFPFETVGWNDDLVRSFASKVDGKPVTVEKLKNVPLKMGDKDEFEEEWARNEVYVKVVEFGENQRRTVLVDYTTGHGHAGSGYQVNGYILETGATWAGKIGTITLTVDWTNTKRISRPALTFSKNDGEDVPRDWTRVSKRRYATEFQNVEPDFNLDLTSILGFWNVRLNGKDLSCGHGIVGSTGPLLAGTPPDVQMMADEGFDSLFNEGHFNMDYFEGKVANAFGNFLTLRDPTTLRDGLGRKHRLRRPAVESDSHGFPVVYMKDLIEALGGTYKWDPEVERIDITLPTRDKPLRKKGDPIPPSRL